MIPIICNYRARADISTPAGPLGFLGNPRYLTAGLCILVLVGISACSTAPPVAPDHPITDNPLPVYSCPEPPVLPPLVLPDWPVLPNDVCSDTTAVSLLLKDDPIAVECKAWYVEMSRVVQVRMDLLEQRGNALDEMLDAYRAE